MKKIKLLTALAGLTVAAPVVTMLTSCNTGTKTADTVVDGLKFEAIAGTKTCTVKASDKSVESIEIPGVAVIGGVEYSVVKIPEFGFVNKTSLKKITFPLSLTYISKCAFKGCTSLKEVNIPENTKKIWYASNGDAFAKKSVNDKLATAINLTSYYMDYAWSKSDYDRIGVTGDGFVGEKPADITLTGGDTVSDKISVTPDYSATDRQVIWVSSDETKASIKGNTEAYVITHKPTNDTQVIMTAYLADDMSKSLSFKVTVNAQDVEIGAEGANIDLYHNPKKLGLDDNNLVMHAELNGGTNNIKWSISEEDQKYATIDANTGKVTPHQEGTVTITVETTDRTSEQASKSCTLQIVKPTDEKAFYFTEVGDTYWINNIIDETVKESSEIVIPAIHNGKPVVSTAWGFVNGNKNLQSVTLPNSMVKIDGDSFNECTSLKEISLPNSLQEIGQTAFNNCSALFAGSDIHFPKSLSTIRAAAFNGNKFTNAKFATGRWWEYENGYPKTETVWDYRGNQIKANDLIKSGWGSKAEKAI